MFVMEDDVGFTGDMGADLLAQYTDSEADLITDTVDPVARTRQLVDGARRRTGTVAGTGTGTGKGTGRRRRRRRRDEMAGEEGEKGQKAGEAKKMKRVQGEDVRENVVGGGEVGDEEEEDGEENKQREGVVEVEAVRVVGEREEKKEEKGKKGERGKKSTLHGTAAASATGATLGATLGASAASSAGGSVGAGGARRAACRAAASTDLVTARSLTSSWVWAEVVSEAYGGHIPLASRLKGAEHVQVRRGPQGRGRKCEVKSLGRREERRGGRGG